MTDPHVTALQAALVCVAVVAAVNWSTRVHPAAVVETISKPLTTVLVMWVAVAAGRGHEPVALALTLAGLTCCLVGDIALLDAVDRFVVGLGAFLVGHLLFVATFATLHLDRLWWGIVAVPVLVGHAAVFGPRIVAAATAREPTLRLPVTAYLVVIVGMAAVAATTGRAWVVAGAGAFVVSDTLLGWRAFVRPPGAPHDRWMALAVMVSYHVAIVGIALGLR